MFMKYILGEVGLHRRIKISDVSVTVTKQYKLVPA